MARKDWDLRLLRRAERQRRGGAGPGGLDENVQDSSRDTPGRSLTPRWPRDWGADLWKLAGDSSVAGSVAGLRARTPKRIEVSSKSRSPYASLPANR